MIWLFTNITKTNNITITVRE